MSRVHTGSGQGFNNWAGALFLHPRGGVAYTTTIFGLVMWRDGDQVFWLRSSDTDALELAATVRPATDAEWDAVPDRPQYDGDPILPG